MTHQNNSFLIFIGLGLFAIIYIIWIILKRNDAVRMGKMPELQCNAKNIDPEIQMLVEQVGNSLHPYFSKELPVGNSSLSNGFPAYINQWLADNPYITITDCNFNNRNSLNFFTCLSRKLVSVNIRGYVTAEKNWQYAILDLKKHNGFFVPDTDDVMRTWQNNNPHWEIVSWHTTVTSYGQRSFTRIGMTHTANIFALARKRYTEQDALPETPTIKDTTLETADMLTRAEIPATANALPDNDMRTDPDVSRSSVNSLFRKEKRKHVYLVLNIFVALILIILLGLSLYTKKQPTFQGNAEYYDLSLFVKQKFPKLIKIDYVNQGNSSYSFGGSNALNTIVQVDGQNYNVSAIFLGNKTVSSFEKGCFFLPLFNIKGTIESIRFNNVYVTSENASADAEEEASTITLSVKYI